MSNSISFSFKKPTRMSPQTVYPSEILSELLGKLSISEILVPVCALVDIEMLVYSERVRVEMGHVSTIVKVTVFLFV